MPSTRARRANAHTRGSMEDPKCRTHPDERGINLLRCRGDEGGFDKRHKRVKALQACETSMETDRSRTSCASEPAEWLRQNALGARESRDVKNVFSSLQPAQLFLFSECISAFLDINEFHSNDHFLHISHFGILLVRRKARERT